MWIDCKEQLPPLHRYVLCYYSQGNWGDSADDPCRIVCKRIGIDDSGDPNNRGAGYKWYQSGTLWFAHYISHWCEIPRPPHEVAETVRESDA